MSLNYALRNFKLQTGVKAYGVNVILLLNCMMRCACTTFLLSICYTNTCLSCIFED